MNMTMCKEFLVYVSLVIASSLAGCDASIEEYSDTDDHKHEDTPLESDVGAALSYEELSRQHGLRDFREEIPADAVVIRIDSPEELAAVLEGMEQSTSAMETAVRPGTITGPPQDPVAALSCTFTVATVVSWRVKLKTELQVSGGKVSGASSSTFSEGWGPGLSWQQTSKKITLYPSHASTKVAGVVTTYLLFDGSVKLYDDYVEFTGNCYAP